MARAKVGRGHCQICHHAQRHLVELGMCLRVPRHVLSKRFDVSQVSLYRHQKKHLTPTMVAAILAAQHPSDINLAELYKRESDGLLASLVHQRARLQKLSEMAFEEGALHTAVSVEKAITASLELTSLVNCKSIIKSLTPTSTSPAITCACVPPSSTHYVSTQKRCET